MRDSSLQAFLAFNEQLLALHSAGIPVVLPRGKSRRAAVDIQRLNAAVALQMGQGASLSEALEQNRRLCSPTYRYFVEASLHRGELTPALNAMHAQAETLEEVSTSLRLSLLYPLLVFCVAYAGLVLFCLVLVPRLQSLLVDLRLPPGTATQFFGTISETLPYWVAILPLVLFVVIGWSRYHNGRSTRWLQWMPGSVQALHDQRYANYANMLANALEANIPFDDALRAAAEMYGGRTANATLDATTAQQGTRTEDSPLPPHLPAFLRWAVQPSHSTTDRIRNLRTAADVYRTSAARQLERLHTLAPAITCVVIGGGITLAYGLMLFLPIVHLLRTLAA